MIDHFYVSITPREAADTVCAYVQGEGISVKLVDSYGSAPRDGAEVILLVFEKYFMRNNSRASLSVLVENLNGTTAVKAIGSGGGQGALFAFDWGAAESFEDSVERALRAYRV